MQTLHDYVDCDDFTLLGYYAEGHHDILEQAIAAYKEESEDDDDLESSPNFNMQYAWYRLPTDDEVDREGYNPEQFVLVDKNTDGFDPITLIRFD